MIRWNQSMTLSNTKPCRFDVAQGICCRRQASSVLQTLTRSSSLRLGPQNDFFQGNSLETVIPYSRLAHASQVLFDVERTTLWPATKTFSSEILSRESVPARGTGHSSAAHLRFDLVGLA